MVRKHHTIMKAFALNQKFLDHVANFEVWQKIMVAGSFHVSNTVVCFEAKSVQIRIVYRLLCIGNLTLHVPTPFVSHTWQQCRKCSL